jgi:uncharacterized protein YndB with AHSA1/START domain
VRLDLVVEELLPHPVQAVWRALTDAEAILDWLMPTTDFRPIVGERFRLRTTGRPRYPARPGPVRRR